MYEKFFMVPAPSFNFGTVIMVNLFKKSHTCPKCRRKVSYYGQFTDNIPAEILSIFDWSFGEEKRYILVDKKYVCPSCKQENLTFNNVGCWD